MIKILFVCHGNICRSPMAEFMMKKLVAEQGVADKFFIESAATSSEEIYNGVGQPVYPPAKRELQKHGISCEGKRARQLTKADYQKFDYLVVMDSNNLRNIRYIIPDDPEEKIFRLLDLSHNPRNVDDPWYTGRFDQTWADISEGLPLLLEKIKRETGI